MSESEELIVDDYELVDCIATGNASQIWQVTQISSSQEFAMKLLLDEVLSDSGERSTMKHEAKVGKSLDHPNIINFFDSKVSRKRGYIVMELFRAANLKSIIRNNLLTVHMRMSKLAESATSAFAHMHEKGWIHKDIKPDNILMTKGSDVRVIDFSLASKAGSAIGHMVTKKSTIAIQGTRTYIAPELIKRERLTQKADIYSLGITFFECLTGRPPFTGTNPNALLMSHIQEKPLKPSELHPNISPQADMLIGKMLSKKPADRHESMQEVLSELRNLNFFKTDPLEYDQKQQAEKAEEMEVSVDQRIDSRADHQHTQKHGNKPAKAPAPKPEVKPEPEPEKPSQPAPAQPAAHDPSQPGMPPQLPPGMPPHMMPGMMPPQGGMPQYPQMPMHPGMMPPGGGYPPGMPQHMPGHQPMPPQGMPGQPPPGQPNTGQPYPGQPGQPQPPSAPAADAAQPETPAPAAPQPPPSAPQPPPSAPAPEEKPDAEPETPEDLDWINIM